MSNKCPNCGNKLKSTIKEEVIKTRLESRKIFTVENLPQIECTVCDFAETHAKGEDVKEIVKYIIKREMQSVVTKEEAIRTPNKIVNLFKRFIG